MYVIQLLSNNNNNNNNNNKFFLKAEIINFFPLNTSCRLAGWEEWLLPFPPKFKSHLLLSRNYYALLDFFPLKFCKMVYIGWLGGMIVTFPTQVQILFFGLLLENKPKPTYYEPRVVLPLPFFFFFWTRSYFLGKP